MSALGADPVRRLAKVRFVPSEAVLIAAMENGRKKVGDEGFRASWHHADFCLPKQLIREQCSPHRRCTLQGKSRSQQCVQD